MTNDKDRELIERLALEVAGTDELTGDAISDFAHRLISAYLAERGKDAAVSINKNGQGNLSAVEIKTGSLPIGTSKLFLAPQQAIPEGMALTGVTHKLKTWPQYFDSVKRGFKTFEIRKNDRDYCPGDMLVLQDWNPETESYSGDEMTFTVTYVMHGGKFGLADDYVVLGIAATGSQP